MEAASKIRRLEEEEKEKEERNAQQKAKQDARDRSKSSKAGTTAMHACNPLQMEIVTRRVKEAAASSGTYEEALLLAGQDIKGMSKNPFLDTCTLIECEQSVDHIETFVDCKQFWARCIGCSDRLINGYYICKGCLHSAWCSMKCYNADTARHVKVWSVYIFALKHLHRDWFPSGSLYITHAHMGSYVH